MTAVLSPLGRSASGASSFLRLGAIALATTFGLMACGEPNIEPEPDPDPTPDVVGEVGEACEPSAADVEALRNAWPLSADASAVGQHGEDAVEVDGYTHYATFHSAEAGSFHYLDLASGDFAALADNASTEAANWQVAIRRTDVRINSGESGPGSVRIARLTDVRFEDVHTVPSDAVWATDEAEWTWTEDEAGELSCAFAASRNKPTGAIQAVNADRPMSSSWYHYELSTHQVSAYRNTVYLVQDDSGQTWKLELSDYAAEGAVATWSVRWAPLHDAVCNAEVAEANVDALLARREPVFDYEANDQLHASSEADGIWTATVQAGGGGGVFSPVNAMTYIDFDTGDIRSYSDFEAAEDPEWELAIRRTAIRFNGGDMGPGHIRVARITRAEVPASAEGANIFDDVKLADAQGNLTWTSDTIAWDWAPELDDDVNEVKACGYASDFLGSPMLTTAYLNVDNASSGDWYSYGAGLGPLPDTIYVLHDTEQDAYWKLELVSYYAATADADPTRQVEYGIRWSRIEG